MRWRLGTGYKCRGDISYTCLPRYPLCARSGVPSTPDSGGGGLPDEGNSRWHCPPHDAHPNRPRPISRCSDPLGSAPFARCTRIVSTGSPCLATARPVDCGHFFLVLSETTSVSGDSGIDTSACNRDLIPPAEHIACGTSRGERVSVPWFDPGRQVGSPSPTLHRPHSGRSSPVRASGACPPALSTTTGTAALQHRSHRDRSPGSVRQ